MAIRIPIVSDFNDKGIKSATASFAKLKADVASANGAMGKFSAATSGAFGMVKANAAGFAAAAGAAFVGFAASSVKAASNLGESINAVKVTFGDASGAILQFSKNAAMNVGMSARQFNEFAVQFAGFAQKVGKSSADTSEIIKELANRTADFASVMNIDIADAASVFQSALAGETEPIKKFGIDMSAAAVEAYALANGLAKTKDAITESVKQQARYGLLMKETNKVAGDFKNTQDGLANSSRTLKAQFEDLQAAAGQRLVPALAEVLSGVVALIDGFEKLNVTVPGTGGKGFFDFLGAALKMPVNLKGAIQDLYGPAEQTGNAVAGLGYKTAETNRMMTLLDRSLQITTKELERQASAVATAVTGWNSFRDSLEFQNEFYELQKSTSEFEAGWAKAVANGVANSEEWQAALRNNKLALLNFAGEILATASVADRTRIRIGIETGEITSAIGLMNTLLGQFASFSMENGTLYGSVGVGGVALGGATVYDAAGKAYYLPPGTDFSGFMADGGVVSGPTLAVIGEAGPEAVIPLDRLAEMRSGGGGNIITINVSGANPNDVVRALQQYVRQSGPVPVNTRAM